MKLTVEISTTAGSEFSPKADQYQRNAIAAVLQQMSDRIQNGGGGEGEVTYDREGLRARFKLENTKEKADV
jgi:hypothetical protein